MMTLGSALPERCARAPKGSSTEASMTAPPPLPVAPVATATTPPVWAPPDTAPPPAPLPPPNPDLAKARAFAQTGDSKKVRAVLEKKVKAGKANKEEATLVLDACAALRDKACIDVVRAKYPAVDAP
jgi:hypothetical protein